MGETKRELKHKHKSFEAQTLEVLVNNRHFISSRRLYTIILTSPRLYICYASIKRFLICRYCPSPNFRYQPMPIYVVLILPLICIVMSCRTPQFSTTETTLLKNLLLYFMQFHDIIKRRDEESISMHYVVDQEI